MPLSRYGLRGGTTHRRARVGLLNVGDPGAGVLQFEENIDRPLICGKSGKSAGKLTTPLGDDERDRAAIVGIAAQDLGQLHHVLWSQVEVRAGDLDDLGESADPGIGKPLSRAADFISGKLSPSDDRHQPMERGSLHINRHLLHQGAGHRTAAVDEARQGVALDDGRDSVRRAGVDQVASGERHQA